MKSHFEPDPHAGDGKGKLSKKISAIGRTTKTFSMGF